MKRIEYLTLARELTGSNDIDVLIAAADKIVSYLEEPPKEPQYPVYFELKTPREFIERLSIHHPIKGLVPFKLYDFQEKILNTIVEAPQGLHMIASSRQMGLTTLISAMALYDAVMKSNQTIMLACHTFNSALHSINNIINMMKNCSVDLPGVINTNKSIIEFDNGSRIIARVSNKHASKGLSLSKVYVTESAFISHSEQANFIASIMPSIATGGSVILQSSVPLEDEGMFYDMWHDTNVIKQTKQVVTWKDHPDRDERWAENNKKLLGEKFFKREHECNDWS